MPTLASTEGSAPTRGTLRLPATGWILGGGAVAIFIGSLLPWVQLDAGFGIVVSSRPRGGGPVLLIALAVAAVAIGWPLLAGPLPWRRWLGLAVVTGVLSIFVITNWSDLGDLESKYPHTGLSAGPGLFLYTAGVVALWVCAVRVWLARRRPAGAVA